MYSTSTIPFTSAAGASSDRALGGARNRRRQRRASPCRTASACHEFASLRYPKVLGHDRCLAGLDRRDVLLAPPAGPLAVGEQRLRHPALAEPLRGQPDREYPVLPRTVLVVAAHRPPVRDRGERRHRPAEAARDEVAGVVVRAGVDLRHARRRLVHEVPVNHRPPGDGWCGRRASTRGRATGGSRRRRAAGIAARGPRGWPRCGRVRSR